MLFLLHFKRSNCGVARDAFPQVGENWCPANTQQPMHLSVRANGELEDIDQVREDEWDNEHQLPFSHADNDNDTHHIVEAH